MNEITITVEFKEYRYTRIKPMGSSNVAYTSKDWVGKKICLIPLPFNVTDRYIESKCKTQEGYKLTIKGTKIINKTVSKGSNVGIVYTPKELLGMDALIIEAPNYDNLY